MLTCLLGYIVGIMSHVALYYIEGHMSLVASYFCHKSCTCHTVFVTPISMHVTTMFIYIKAGVYSVV